MPTTIVLDSGDKAIVAGATLTADRTVELTSDQPIERIPAPGLTDLPETGLRIKQLWPDSRGRRVPMQWRQHLRCPCGSAYTRGSETHHSCAQCGRVWPNETIEAAVNSPRAAADGSGPDAGDEEGGRRGAS